MQRVATFQMLIGLTAALSLGGCKQAAPPAAATTESTSAVDEDYAMPPFVGKVWIATTPGKPRGAIKIFLPDKTLLIDSCFETFRIVRWGVVADDAVRWLEDSIPIEAKWQMLRPDSLRLIIAGAEPETYMTASAPYVCPDMPK